MKNHILPATLITLCCIIFFSGVYTLSVWGVAQFAPNKGKGEIIQYGTVGQYGFTNIGQSFTQDKYFWSRPSAVGYNAASSAGSNKGPSNPDYLTQVQARIDTFLIHNPGVEKGRIPADMVTASGSGLDPHISLQAALVQVPRIAKLRGLSEESVTTMVHAFLEQRFLGFLGPIQVNVLKLNIALETSKK